MKKLILGKAKERTRKENLKSEQGINFRYALNFPSGGGFLCDPFPKIRKTQKLWT